MLRIALTALFIFIISIPSYAQETLDTYRMPDMFGQSSKVQQENTKPSVKRPIPPKRPEGNLRRYSTIIDNTDIMEQQELSKPTGALLLPAETENYEEAQEFDIPTMNARDILDSLQGNN